MPERNKPYFPQPSQPPEPPPLAPEDLDNEIKRITREIITASEQPGELDAGTGIDDRDGIEIREFTPKGNLLASLDAQRILLTNAREELTTTGGISASVSAQIAQQQRQLEESRRQFDAGFKQSAEQFEVREKANTRETNIDAILDQLESEIRVGELSARDATNRITAATEAAGIQRDLLTELGPYSIPQGAQYVPNLGPDSAVAAAAAALGIPFPGFGTGGGMQIDPAQLVAGILAAPGQGAAQGLAGTVQGAQGALAGQGVPPPTQQGPALRQTGTGASSVAKALVGG